MFMYLYNQILLHFMKEHTVDKYNSMKESQELYFDTIKVHSFSYEILGHSKLIDAIRKKE